MVLISGGDRHGVEPNANLNLTQRRQLHRVRARGSPRAARATCSSCRSTPSPGSTASCNSTLAAIRNYPDFPEGSRRWDDRVFHPDAEGEYRDSSLSFGAEAARRSTSAAVLAFVRLLGAAPVSSGLRLAWNDASAMRTALADRKA